MEGKRYKFRFIKLSPKLLTFGILEDTLRYSDVEKTILDFTYAWRYIGVPKEKIALDVLEWAKYISEEKTRKYAANYPKTVQEIAGRMESFRQKNTPKHTHCNPHN